MTEKLTPETLRSLSNIAIDVYHEGAKGLVSAHLSALQVHIEAHATAWEAELARLRELIERAEAQMIGEENETVL